MAKPRQDNRPLGARHSWAQTPNTWIAGQAAINGTDQVAVTMEQKWGVGRLPLLVSTELREKFYRQDYLLNQAIWHGDLEAVRTQSARMAVAWQALDKAAEAAGAEKVPRGVWEVALEDGTLAVISRYRGDVRTTDGDRDGRRVVYYSLEEIARMLSNYRAVTDCKLAFPGATVTAVRRPHDPLDDIRDTLGGLDDPINDPLPTFGN